MILAVDLGNYNIKTSEGIIFSSRFVKDNNKVEPLENSSIEYNEDTYYMERGKFENEFNKTKKNYLPNLLYAIAKSVPEDILEIKLVLGVPLSNLGVGDCFKTDLEGKSFTFKYNNKTRTVLISKIGIIGEGISSYYALNETQRANDTVIIDIGGRTVNVAAYKNKKLDAKFTINRGMIHLYNQILEVENNTNGTDYSVQVVQEYIDKGIFNPYDDIKLQFLKDILDDIKPHVDLRAFNVFWTGGGAINLEYTIKSLNLNNSKLMNDCIFSNVVGNKRVVEIKWR